MNKKTTYTYHCYAVKDDVNFGAFRDPRHGIFTRDTQILKNEHYKDLICEIYNIERHELFKHKIISLTLIASTFS